MSSQVADKSFVTTFVALISALVLLVTVLFMVAALVGVVGSIAPDDGFLGRGEGNPVAAVDEQIVRRRGEFQDGVPHGRQRSLENVDSVDHIGFDQAEADGKGVCPDPLIQTFPLSRGQPL